MVFGYLVIFIIIGEIILFTLLRRSFDKVRYWWLYYLACVLMFGVSGTAYEVDKKVKQEIVEVKSAESRYTSVQNILSILKDMEIGQRGYLITNKESYLQPYNENTILLDSAIEKLANIYSNNARITSLINLIKIKRIELETTIALVKQNKTEEAFARINTDEGKNTMDAIRVLCKDLKDQEHAEVIDNIESSEIILDQLSWIKIGMMCFSVSLMIYGVWAQNKTNSSDNIK